MFFCAFLFTRIFPTLIISNAGSGLDEDGVRLFTEELSIVYNLNHSNLLKPHHFDECGGCPYLVLPYCERGSSQRLIGKLTEEEAWRFLHDVSAGLEYLHAKEPPVIHQDIKPDQCFAGGFWYVYDYGFWDQYACSEYVEAERIACGAFGRHDGIYGSGALRGEACTYKSQ